MRNLTLLVLAVSPVLGGCQDTCGSPTQLNGREWNVFTNALTWTIENEDHFPSYESPANGPTVYQIDWGPAAEGAITLTIDGQSFTGTGGWDTQECGNFWMKWNGEYVSASGSTHSFGALGLFLTYEEHLEGDIEWAEAWTSADGSEHGKYVMEGLLRGLQVGAPVQ